MFILATAITPFHIIPEIQTLFAKHKEPINANCSSRDHTRTVYAIPRSFSY